MERKRAREYQLLCVLCSFCVFAFTTGTFAQKKKDQSKILAAQADTLLNHQDFEGALHLYNKIIKKTKLKNDKDYEVLYRRSIAYYSLGEFEKALHDADQYLLKFNNPEALLLRASLYQELGNSEALLDDLNELVVIIGDNPDLLRWRTSVLLDLRRYKEAQRDIQALMAFNADPALQLYLGLTYYYLNSIDSAFIEFDKVIETYPSFMETYEYVGSICIDEGYFDQALRYLNKGLTQEPDNSTLLFYKGVALVEIDNREDGCRFLRKAFDKGLDEAAGYLKEYCFGIEGR